MSQYDNPISLNYKFAAVNFATGSTAKIPVPYKAQGARVGDIAVVASVTFTQVTTPGLVQVGDGTTADKFASLNIGGTTSGNSIAGGDVGGVYKAYYLAANYNSGAGLHDLIVTFVAPTGGTPAGTGDVYVSMLWDQIGSK